MTHVFLKTRSDKDITMTVGRHGVDRMPARGENVTVSYAPEAGIVLPEGKMARD